MEDLVGPIIIAIGVAIGLWLLFTIVNIVREYERLVVFLFGRLQGAKGPGIVLLIPFVQQAVKVDLRERFLEVPQQTCITRTTRRSTSTSSSTRRSSIRRPR